MVFSLESLRLKTKGTVNKHSILVSEVVSHRGTG